MDYPGQPFKRFRFLTIPLGAMAHQAAAGQLDEPSLRTHLARAVAFADLPAFQKECLRYPLLQVHCQAVTKAATTWLRRFRRQARHLLEKGAEAKGLRRLDKQYQVLDEIMGILSVAAERAMGPTPDGTINVLLRLAAGHHFSRLRFACRGYRDALSSWPLEPWGQQHLDALGGVLRAVRLLKLGDRADRPADLTGALAELKRVGMVLPVPEGPQLCDRLEKSQPLSSIWRKNRGDSIISRAFPDWPWWWIWPTREPFLTVNEMLEGGTLRRTG